MTALLTAIAWRAVGSSGAVCVADTAPFEKLMAKGGHGTH